MVTLRTLEGKLLAKWNLDMPDSQVGQATPAPSGAPQVADRATDAPWPETHLPLSEGPHAGARAAASPAAATWNPIHPAAPTIAALPAEPPWPETHLPLARGLDRKAPAMAQRNAPLLPAKAPKAAAGSHWPETHLPLPEGRHTAAPTAVTWNPIHPAVPPIAALPAEPPWPETHLPLARGLDRKAPAMAQRTAPLLPAKPPKAAAGSHWPEMHLPLPEGRHTAAPTAVTWNPIHPAVPPIAALPAEPPWPETHLPLAQSLGRPAPAMAQRTAPSLPAKPPKAAVGSRWPETHLPLPEGHQVVASAGTSPTAATWNPIHPAASTIAALPAEPPWPETHLPLVQGLGRPAPAMAQRTAPSLPAKPPKAAAGSPWPETHLPLPKGRQSAAAAPPATATWNPIHPAVPKIAALPSAPPWPETHLPLAQGLDRKVPVERAATPVLAPATLPWPETHLPPSKGQVRITLARPLLVPEDGLRGAAVPSPPTPPALRPLLAEAKARFWPDTHRPLVQGQAASAVPTVAVATPPWPETHLPPSKGLFRIAAAKPVLPPPASLPPPPPVQIASLSWPETHLPLTDGEPRKVVPKPLPRVPPEETAPPAPAAIPAPAAPPALPSPSAPEWPGQGEAFNLVRGPRGGHWVCITFDGGSSDEVALDVLNALKERGICTTFFLTGDFIGKFPDIVRRIVRDGHEVGNHTMDHPHLAPGGKRDPRWTKERFQQQLLQADAAFLRLAGRPMDPYWRAPYGEQTTEIRRWAEELGYRHIAWSEGADTLDWATVKERKLYRTGNAILDRLRDRMERQDGDGLVVLMHLGSARPEGDRPARVLGPFLDQALDGGWNFVNIGTYLKEAGKARWDASSRLAMLTPRAVHP